MNTHKRHSVDTLTLKTFRLRWAPTMAVIAIVRARDAKAARRKAPKPYRKFLGEIDVEEVKP